MDTKNNVHSKLLTKKADFINPELYHINFSELLLARKKNESKLWSRICQIHTTATYPPWYLHITSKSGKHTGWVKTEIKLHALLNQPTIFTVSSSTQVAHPSYGEKEANKCEIACKLHCTSSQSCIFLCAEHIYHTKFQILSLLTNSLCNSTIPELVLATLLSVVFT